MGFFIKGCSVSLGIFGAILATSASFEYLGFLGYTGILILGVFLMIPASYYLGQAISTKIEVLPLLEKVQEEEVESAGQNLIKQMDDLRDKVSKIEKQLTSFDLLTNMLRNRATLIIGWSIFALLLGIFIGFGMSEILRFADLI